LSGRVLAWSTALLRISRSTMLRVILVLGRVGWWAMLLAVALLRCGWVGVVARLLRVGRVLRLLLVVASVPLRLLILSVLGLGVLLLLRIATLLTVLRLAIVLLLRVTTLLAIAAVGITVIIVGRHVELWF
jgi:hypothetical protein